MRTLITTTLLWTSATGCGLMAGVYFAFSAFVMTSLGRISPASGIAAMNAISVDIVKSLFMPVFLITTLTAASLLVLSLTRWGQAGSALMAVAGAVYVLGMFGVTMMFNVPLNDALAGADPASPQSAALWSRYVTDWTMWNHVRTAASIVATSMFMIALLTR